jgi:hypothetical protein
LQGNNGAGHRDHRAEEPTRDDLAEPARR